MCPVAPRPVPAFLPASPGLLQCGRSGGAGDDFSKGSVDRRSLSVARFAVLISLVAISTENRSSASSIAFASRWRITAVSIAVRLGSAARSRLAALDPSPYRASARAGSATSATASTGPAGTRRSHRPAPATARTRCPSSASAAGAAAPAPKNPEVTSRDHRAHERNNSLAAGAGAQ